MPNNEKMSKDATVEVSSVGATANVGTVTVHIEKKLPYIVIIIGITIIIIALAATLGLTLGADVAYWLLAIVSIIIGLMALEPRYREQR